MTRIFGLVAALVATALVAAAPAVAAPTTIGSLTGDFRPAGIQCLSALQLTTAPGSPSYVVPFDGTITSWSVQGVGEPSTARLQVYRPAGANRWVLVAESGLKKVRAGAVSTFSTRIAVRQGDILGRTGLGCAYTSEVGGDTVLTFGTRPAVGSVVTPDGPGASAWRLNVRAKVEPDCRKSNRKKPKVCKSR